MLRFTGNDLRPVLAEATANKCRVVFVKDHGVYMMSEIGAKDESGRRKILAYAIGCNPDVDAFEDWWERSRRELGGDDFGEYFDVTDAVFVRVLNSSDDLIIRATKTQLVLEARAPKTSTH